MLTISEVAKLYKISNRQVHDLIDYGYLNVAHITRNSNKGIKYLFSEEQVSQLDIYSHLEEIKEKKINYPQNIYKKKSDFKKVLQLMNHYDDFIERLSIYPEYQFLKICFYLFHLNHYAKTYPEQSNELYGLKNQVIKKMYYEHYDFIEATYLLGPDKKKIWLCEDCKDAAHEAKLSYKSYINQELFCPKCSIQSIEKEYYSLIEFVIKSDEYRFNFHLPRSQAIKWLKEIDLLPQKTRNIGKYEDRMYMYGRSISRIEEKVFPLAMLIKELNQYIQSDSID